MPMTSDEHAELLMRQNNRRLFRSSLMSSLILLVLLSGIGYLIFKAVIQNDSNPEAERFLMVSFVLLIVLELSRMPTATIFAL